VWLYKYVTVYLPNSYFIRLFHLMDLFIYLFFAYCFVLLGMLELHSFWCNFFFSVAHLFFFGW
jgi:hypothetical protein